MTSGFPALSCSWYLTVVGRDVDSVWTPRLCLGALQPEDSHGESGRSSMTRLLVTLQAKDDLHVGATPIENRRHSGPDGRRSPQVPPPPTATPGRTHRP